MSDETKAQVIEQSSNVIDLAATIGSAKRERRTRGPILPGLGITAREEQFCQLVVQNACSYTEAYRRAYGAFEMKPESAQRRAVAIAQKEMVIARIKVLVQGKRGKDVHDPASIRAFVLEKLHERASQTENLAASVKSLELLGKVDRVRLFVDDSANTSDNAKTAEELRQALAIKLRSLFSPKST